MEKLLLKGYVTPADCDGNLQMALDTAARLGLNKVVVEENLEAGAISIPAGMYLVLKNCSLTAQLTFDGGENFSFCKKWLTVEGQNATLDGSIHLFNAAHTNFSNLTVTGEIVLEYVNWGRLENINGTVRVGRGTVNCILQNITAAKTYISGDCSCGRLVPGSKPEVTNIILQDSTTDVVLTAAEDCGLLNIQADHITGNVQVGTTEHQLADAQFMNLTFTHISGSVTLDNPAKHTYIR